MSQLSKMTQSRDQWKHKAKQRGEHERSQRKQNARLKAQYNRTTTAFKATQARLRQLEAQLHGLATVPKVDVPVEFDLVASKLGVETSGLCGLRLCEPPSLQSKRHDHPANNQQDQ